MHYTRLIALAGFHIFAIAIFPMVVPDYEVPVVNEQSDIREMMEDDTSTALILSGLLEQIHCLR
jgi:hypothetical protein